MKNIDKEKRYSYQQICNMLCEACKAGLPAKYQGFQNGFARYHHRVQGTDISCGASAWMGVTLKKPVKHKHGEYYWAELK